MRHKYKIIGLTVLAITYQTAMAATPAEKQPILFNDLATKCASHVDSSTLQAIVRTESSFNPFAIGVVRDSVKQPTTFAEAVETAKELHEKGKNFSMGLAQINRYNLEKYGLDYESVFDVCKNLKVGADILAECYGRAPGKKGQEALQEALSCYYSGNFRTGFGNDLKGLPSYVERILNAAKRNHPDQKIKTFTEKPSTKQAVTTVPAIDADAKPVKVSVRASTTNRSNQKPVAIKDANTNNKQVNNSPRPAWDAFSEW